MCNCFDINKLLAEAEKPDFDSEAYGLASLGEVVAASFVEDKESIQPQYTVFKQRVLDLLTNKTGNFEQIRGENKHILWETHQCTSECNVKRQAQCQNYQQLIEPKKVKNMKVLHLFLKTPELYEGLSDLLDLYRVFHND